LSDSQSSYEQFLLDRRPRRYRLIDIQAMDDESAIIVLPRRKRARHETRHGAERIQR
jgi:hypothetical protein